jgi:hypothetical protein
LSHRSSQSLLSIKHPNIQTDYWTNMECWGGKLGERVFTVVSIVKPKRCTNVSNLFYFGMTLYMFRTAFPSIIRSSRLYIKQQAFVKQILLSAWYISIVKPTRCTNVSNLFYFAMTLYMFRTVFPSIIRSSRLYIKQQAFVKEILLSAWYIVIVKPTRCTSVPNLLYFGMTLYMFRKVFPSVIRSSRLYIQQKEFVKQTLLYVQSWNSWWWTEGPSETCRVSFQNEINLIHWWILLVLL